MDVEEVNSSSWRSDCRRVELFVNANQPLTLGTVSCRTAAVLSHLFSCHRRGGGPIFYFDFLICLSRFDVWLCRPARLLMVPDEAFFISVDKNVGPKFCYKSWSMGPNRKWAPAAGGSTTTTRIYFHFGEDWLLIFAGPPHLSISRGRAPSPDNGRVTRLDSTSGW